MAAPPNLDNAATPLFRVTPKISKRLLCEDDYPAWSVEAARQLRRQRLLNIVDDTDPRPDVGCPEQLKWDDESDRAIDYLMESCEEEPQNRIRAAHTAAEAWATLKSIYEGRTRTRLLHLFSAVNTPFDDCRISLLEHITAFESAWLRLAQNVSTAVAGTDSMAAGIKAFTLTDSWKAAMLLQSLPKIQPYINIVMNITSSHDTPTYANVVIRLKETQHKPGNQKSHCITANTDTSGTPAAFATSEHCIVLYCICRPY